MIWPALIIVLLDQISKLAIVHSLKVYESVPVIAGFFDLVHVRNRGMAFGLMNRSDLSLVFYLLVAASVVAIVLLLLWFFKLKNDQTRISLGLSLILGGAMGNLIDRIRVGEVIDFLDLYIGPYHWPAFNLADSAITVGTIWVALTIVFQHQKPSKA